MIDPSPVVTNAQALATPAKAPGRSQSGVEFNELLRGSATSFSPESQAAEQPKIDESDQTRVPTTPSARGRIGAGERAVETPLAGPDPESDQTRVPTTPSARGRIGAGERAVETLLAGPDPEGFVRSKHDDGPVRYQAVPEWAKAADLFRQAPLEYGGEFWKVSPFSSSTPWTILDGPFTKPVEELPEGFEALFGTRPKYHDFDNYMPFKVAEMGWQQSLDRFKGVGMPPNIDPDGLQKATDIAQQWGLGEPHFYEGAYGWRAKFPESANPNFEINPTTLIMAPDTTVARYQLGLIQLGNIPETFHPFVPPRIIAELISEKSA